MIKKKSKKLTLTAETLRNLTDPQLLQEVLGGATKQCTTSDVCTATFVCSGCAPCA